ncbi:hypothetical protein LZ32DRAFT_357322 [Colletotrichum eremochloae]|nr:hypothetical protein LZ32DRAFT_357322 [Colletotrichum eremochloae]
MVSFDVDFSFLSSVGFALLLDFACGSFQTVYSHFWSKRGLSSRWVCEGGRTAFMAGSAVDGQRAEKPMMGREERPIGNKGCRCCIVWGGVGVTTRRTSPLMKSKTFDG